METKTTTTNQAQGAKVTDLQKKQQLISDSVLERVTIMEQDGSLCLPKGYHAGNALKLAWLYLQTVEDKNHKPALQVCTRDSIANCLLEMCVKGLNVAKKQCYFIVTGNQLSFWEDYRGRLMRAKRDTPVAEVYAQVVYDGDNFVFEIDELGQYQLVKHETALGNIDITKIVGAYAIVVKHDGSKHMELMTMAQIRKSWMQGAAKGNSGAHNNFTDEMCKKTVISRACKIALGSTPEEMEETDAAAQQRAAAQAAAPVMAEYEELQEAPQLVNITEGKISQVVNTDTGEILEEVPAAAPANDAQAAALENCPL